MTTIDFDKPRPLVYNLAAIRDLERAMDGEPLGVLVNKLAQLGVNALVMFLWAGMKHDDRALTPHLVQVRLETYLQNGGKIRALADGINDALEESGLFKTAADEQAAAANPSTPTSQ